LKSEWVDFKVIKSAVNLQVVLDHYGINWLRKNGNELRGRCPIHQGEGNDAFHVNLVKNAFQCFSCKAKGNVLDFVAAMEECSVRDAAVRLAQWFTIAEPESGMVPSKEAARKHADGESEPVFNKPLTFQLKGIDPAHPYLVGRGIPTEVAAAFGVGYFGGKGSMAGRVVIPIHNEGGELVAYAGRAIDDSEPRYKLPGGFHKSLELFNLHRAIGESNPSKHVVLVEGFFDCITVTMAGFASVALMGSSLSEHQEQLLAHHFDRICLMMDGDAPGKEAVSAIALKLMRRAYVRIVDLRDGKQPDQLACDEICSLIGK